MEKLIAFAQNNQGMWTLEKTDVIKPLVKYIMKPLPKVEPYPQQLLFDVTNSMLNGKCVGVLADGAALQALTGLSALWHDGRLLRRPEGCSFVSIEPCFNTPTKQLKNAYISQMASFHFSVFSSSTPEETMLNHMLNTPTDAPLRIEIPKSGNEMIIIVHTNQIKEKDFLSMLSSAVSSSGRNLQYNM